jgi:hypothetical protein
MATKPELIRAAGLDRISQEVVDEEIEGGVCSIQADVLHGDASSERISPLLIVPSSASIAARPSVCCIMVL